MNWIVALLYILSGLLALALIMCGMLLYMSWRNHLFAGHRPADGQPPYVRKTTEAPSPLPGQAKEEEDPTERLSEESRLLWDKMQRLMQDKEVWRDPDLTLNQLATMLGSNRTRISKLIQEAGYGGYKDLVNRHRVKAFLRLAESGKMTSIQDAFFSVGYQSKMTALRHFKEYTGMTPTEYLKKER